MLKRSIICILLIVAPICSQAATGYFDKNSISPTLLSPPFADKSPQQKKELQYIISLQKKASKEDIEKANAERELTPEIFVKLVLPNLTRESYPDVYTLLDKVDDTSHGVTDVAKDYWHTDRPYMVDKNVKPLIKAHTNRSYPSGHTSGSYTWAHVMNLLMPERGADFYARAKVAAEHRVLVGMHFPKDLEGGKQLALLTMGGLLQNKEFLADLEKAKDELKAHPLQ